MVYFLQYKETVVFSVLIFTGIIDMFNHWYFTNYRKTPFMTLTVRRLLLFVRIIGLSGYILYDYIFNKNIVDILPILGIFVIWDIYMLHNINKTKTLIFKKSKELTERMLSNDVYWNYVLDSSDVSKEKFVSYIDFINSDSPKKAKVIFVDSTLSKEYDVSIVVETPTVGKEFIKRLTFINNITCMCIYNVYNDIEKYNEYVDGLVIKNKN